MTWQHVRGRLRVLHVLFWMRLHRWALRHYRSVTSNPQSYRQRPKYSEHAVLRYLQRIDGQDISHIDQAMLDGELWKRINEFGGDCKVVYKGVKYTVKKGMIVTVSPPNKTDKNLEYHDLKTNQRRWTF